MNLHGNGWLTRVYARVPDPTRPDPGTSTGVGHKSKTQVTRATRIGLGVDR